MRARHAIAIAVALFAGVASGCGDDPDRSETTSTTTPSTIANTSTTTAASDPTTSESTTTSTSPVSSTTTTAATPEAQEFIASFTEATASVQAAEDPCEFQAALEQTPASQPNSDAEALASVDFNVTLLEKARDRADSEGDTAGAAALSAAITDLRARLESGVEQVRDYLERDEELEPAADAALSSFFAFIFTCPETQTPLTLD